MSLPARQARRRGHSLVRTAPVRLTRATTDEGTHINERALVARVGYLLTLATDLTTRLLASRWNEADLATYLAPDQAQFAYKAWGQTFGWPDLDEEGYLPSRVGWMALEAAGRTLRSSGFRRDILTALLAADAAPEKERESVLWHLLPPKTDAVSLRNLRRRLVKFTQEHDCPATSFFDLEPDPPHVARQALLAATDRQLCEMNEKEIRLLLPVIPTPQSPADWVWHTIPYRYPSHLEGIPCRPTLRIAGTRLLADIPFERTVPPALSPTPQRALGLDWGTHTPLVGALVTLVDGKPVTDGRPLHFAAPGVQAKIYRLGRQIEELSTKIDAYSRLLKIPLDMEPDQVVSDHPLTVLRARLWTERLRVSARLHHLLDAFAHAASRWAIESALAAHADTLYLEDLRTMEPELGPRQNRAVTLGLRGAIADAITYKAPEVGLTALTVNPRGTSSHCPRCGEPAAHFTAPDSSKPGYRWLRCSGSACGTSLDRDHAGAERIGGRGLAPAAKFVTRTPMARPARPAPGTLPARGSRAKQRRELYEARRASSVATPHRSEQSSGYRAAGARTKVVPTTQPRATFDLPSTERCVRRLDGMRSAFLGLVTCSPILDGRATTGPPNQVTIG